MNLRDAGDNSLVAGITTDLEGNLRLADDPATADTGSGVAPIVDMGAYEFQTAADTDGDGIPDDTDPCPDSDLADTIVIDGIDSGVVNDLLEDGCSISDLIMATLDSDPSAKPLVELLVELKSESTITGQEMGAILKAFNAP